jgi:hypothetical protein
VLNFLSHERYYSFAFSCLRRYCANVKAMIVGIILFLVFRLWCAASPICSEVFVAASNWFYFRLSKYLREQISISILILCSGADIRPLFSYDPVVGGVSLGQLVLSDCRWIGFRFVKSGYVVVYLRLFGPDRLNVRPCVSLFGPSVTKINRGHFLHNRRNY